MKIDSYILNNEEVITALRMFNDETWDYDKYHLISVESILEDGESIADFVKKKSYIEPPRELLDQIQRFAMSFDNEWLVYVLYTEEDFCGLISFSEWY